jgi:NADH-quinone oxidoreductase subunit H
MAEFSAQDVLKPRWDPVYKGQAIRVLLLAAGLLAALTAVNWLALKYFRLDGQPLALLLAVIGPLLTAGAAATAAAVIQFHAPIGQVLKKIPFVFFYGGVFGLIAGVWAAALLFRLVDRIEASQDVPARGAYTYFAGELTLGEIQSYLAGGATGAGGLWGLAAALLWPLQFQLVRDVLAVVGVVGFVSLVAMFAIWWERKVAGRIQSRLGPMRVGGWHGWAQSLADGLKLIQKEDIVTEGADKPLYKLAPYLAFVPALAAFIALPFGTYWIFRNLDVGLIFILAMLGIEVVGVILAGWASNNKWSVYGSMREACQMVSYEIPMGLSLLVPIMTIGTLNLTEIGARQDGGFHTWLAFANPFTFIAAVTYYMSSLANCKRAPFDLPEAESELVAGFMTEYSGFRWCLFFFAEYAAMFVVSGLAVILFLGAWHSPLPMSWAHAWWGADWSQWTLWQKALGGVLFSGPLWFIGKSFFLVYIQMWIRWTLPRIRLDQVMYACVQVLLPLTMVVLLGATVWNLLVPPVGELAGAGPVARAVAVGTNGLLTLIGVVLVAGFLVIGAYGFMNRRRLVGSMAVEHLPGA